MSSSNQSGQQTTEHSHRAEADISLTSAGESEESLPFDLRFLGDLMVVDSLVTSLPEEELDQQFEGIRRKMTDSLDNSIDDLQALDEEQGIEGGDDADHQVTQEELTDAIIAVLSEVIPEVAASVRRRVAQALSTADLKARILHERGVRTIEGENATSDLTTKLMNGLLIDVGNDNIDDRSDTQEAKDSVHAGTQDTQEEGGTA
ncbi:hypothetical protein BD324DRAFT_647856 [Kockovaella imperatae]|uniref:Uncharacterized protein n=1 Tax=Kockovaella imperatae TaxID=4999 RepID=A0A1Y1USF8_9TREE|nr:hypothetical protein BD324DRAFT_647856 [Kockovaella imperatae]ORX40953.1 hypothetical protein BD324DRAFT_647856 [Kockovaella imperatae]